MKRRKLTKREARKAVKMVAEGISVPDAMISLGFAKSTAQDHPERIQKNLYFQEALNLLEQSLLKRDQGLFDLLAEVLIVGLDAKKMLADGTLYSDYTERRKYAELIARIFRQFDDKTTKNDAESMNFNVLIEMIQQAEKERGLN